LFDTPATLVFAPPWMGKTTTAKAINTYLETNAGKLEPKESGVKSCRDPCRFGAPH